MSRTPLQWQAISDNRHFDGRRRASDDESQGLTATLSYPYSTHQPPRFLYPDIQGYDPTTINSPYPRFSFQGRPWDNGAESSGTLPSGSTGSLALHGVQRSSLLKGVDYSGAHNSYDTSSHSRGSIGSLGRANDMDSQ
ncbi:hypothetical protein EYZ11_006416 [Aspergillus tanneri]|uniref:Uncharacterized protein n=1 Tax=Aspergillus tanneri TaxID=1220188 RepID=A0A4S3JHS4_9EURO|nr:uncharacterized protein ATNIH1004_004756 [Aspergillus tanneri]KAA8648870.1 hypothetical protein ATNIH1004_004756 [Aspergillus tanneri]THC94087.1 hypothetical protein EYZ11_006416 [Aspergillus tanneri]